jgi:cell division protein FtsB
MKKIAIILSAILLCGTFCFGEQSKLKFQSNDDIKISLNKTVENITIQNINEGTDISIKSSDDYVVRYDTIIYMDNNKADITITGIEYGYAYIEVCDPDTTIRRKITVNDEQSFEVMADIIASLRGQPSQFKKSPVSESGHDTGQPDNPGERGIPYNFISYVLAVLVLVLLVLLFVIKSTAKKKSLQTQEQCREAAEKLDTRNKEKNNLENQIGQLSAEKAAWEKEKRDLQDWITRLQRSPIQQSSPNPMSSPVIEKPTPTSLYADAIINGKFNRVKEFPNEDTIFELKLNKADDMRATVTIYEAANRRIIANPSFLEGCEKQILGNSSVTMLREGVAQKDGSGNWAITTTLEVKIS